MTILSKLQCIDASFVESPSLSAILYPTQVVITTEKDEYLFPLNYYASWVRIYPCQREGQDFVVLVFGTTTVSTYRVASSGIVEQLGSLSVKSRISVFAFHEVPLAIAMIGISYTLPSLTDGVVQLWSLKEAAWKPLGIQQIVTCRVTGISIQRYPLVVIGISFAQILRSGVGWKHLF